MAAGAGCLTGLLVALAGATPAAAVTGDRPAGVLPALSEPQLRDTFLDVARSYWPGAPCTGRETVELDAGAAIDAAATAETGGMAYQAECRVLIRGGMTPTEFCATLAHELGHLAGQEHTADGIMDGDLRWVGPCVEAAAAHEFSAEWHRAVAALPDHGTRWRLARSDARSVNGEEAFVAARSGFRRRLLVVLERDGRRELAETMVLRASGAGERCGNVPLYVSAAIDIQQSNTSCRRARQIASLWQRNSACADDRCRLYGYSCRGESYDSERFAMAARVQCRARGARVTFKSVVP